MTYFQQSAKISSRQNFRPYGIILLAGIHDNSIHSLRKLSHAAFQCQCRDFLSGLEMEPPDAERVVVGSRDHSLVSSLKERVSRRNLISQSARPAVDILSRFLNVYQYKVARATQVLFSSDTQLRS